MPLAIQFCLVLPLVSGALTGLALVGVGLGWQRWSWSLRTRLGYGAMILLGLGFMGYLHVWNLLGFRW